MTETDARTSSAAFASGVLSPPGPRRDPPKAVRLLLPVWGRRYIAQFINIGLPTLIAPGNLPAVAAALPTKLVFLTSLDDAAILREHPAYRYLSTICEVEIETIDDLITGDNYSTTLTLAYARGVRAVGPEMVDTCFFFLISDYLIANGSLAHVLARMQTGASGLLAGNFQVVEEQATKTFFKHFDRGTAELVLPARELMRWALRHLHPMTAANTVNFPLSRNTHSNRLFWRIDEHTLIGRFYLMHMICIRPEVNEFIVGSSCDYSFIPEMCPSDNVEVLTDSDDYLVVEMQPFEHERGFQRLGAKQPRELAASLSEWTTARHRKNAQSVIVFHGEDIPPAISAAVSESGAFVAELERLMTATPQPHRNHPYWIGAIEAHNWAIRRRKSVLPERKNASLKEALPQNAPVSVRSVVQRLRESLFGRPPDVRPWHPRWSDYRAMRDSLRQLSGPRSRLLIVSPTPHVYTDWLESAAGSTTSLETRSLLNLSAQQYRPLIGSFDGCIVMAGEEEFEFASSLIERIRPVLIPDGFILATALNGRSTALGEGFNRLIVRHSTKFLDLGVVIAKVEFVQAGILRLGVIGFMLWLAAGMVRRPLVFYPLALIVGGPLLAVSFISNLKAMRGSPSVEGEICSSVTMVLRPSGPISFPDFGTDEIYSRQDRYRLLPGYTPHDDVYGRAHRYKLMPSSRTTGAAKADLP